MPKTILITGSTDGIGLETAKLLVQDGHKVLLHGRNAGKLDGVLKALPGTEGFVADLSSLDDTVALAQAVAAKHDHLDVLINNAGVFKMADASTPLGIDARFVVNTLAPYLLTQKLLPLMGAEGRVVNLSSAAQAPVNLRALAGQGTLGDMDAYAQSKLAITMWSAQMAMTNPKGPVVIAVNLGSLLGTKMVQQGFGTSGNDIGIGADILARAALAPEFADASGKYFDNDRGDFGPPHGDALDARKSADVVQVIEDILAAQAA